MAPKRRRLNEQLETSSQRDGGSADWQGRNQVKSQVRDAWVSRQMFAKGLSSLVGHTNRAMNVVSVSSCNRSVWPTSLLIWLDFVRNFGQTNKCPKNRHEHRGLTMFKKTQ